MGWAGRDLRAHPGMCRDISHRPSLWDWLCWMTSPASPGLRTQPMGGCRPCQSPDPAWSHSWHRSCPLRMGRTSSPSCSAVLPGPGHPPRASIPTSELPLIPSGISPPLSAAAFSALLGFCAKQCPGTRTPPGLLVPFLRIRS